MNIIVNKILLHQLGVMLLIFLLTVPSFVKIAKAADLPLRGINLAGGEFGSNKLPGALFKDYIFPSKQDIKAYADFGFQLIRLPFKWERLQPKLNNAFEKNYLGYIEDVVSEANKYGVVVVLDVHNYGMYRKEKIGSSNVPTSSFEDLWFRLATHFKNHKNVIFGLMNEPNKHDAAEWFPIAQAAVTKIRETKASQTIFIPSTFWSNAHRFLLKDGDYSNAEMLSQINDPMNNFVFEVHTYFDHDSSGTHNTCDKGDTIGINRLEEITQWLNVNQYQAFLGEFGASKNKVCLSTLDKTLAFMDDHKNAWYGWAYWAASPWFGDYMYNVYPPDINTYPQAKILKKYIGN